MKRTALCIAFALTLAFFVVHDDARAQGGTGGKGGGGWGSGGAYSRMYDPKTVETVTGEVESVEKMKPMRRMSYGIHLVLKTDKETIPVHLGPSWYIESQKMKIAPKDRVEVKGSRITFRGKPALIAAEVRRGDEVLKLRDENGIPVWSGRQGT